MLQQIQLQKPLLRSKTFFCLATLIPPFITFIITLLRSRIYVNITQNLIYHFLLYAKEQLIAINERNYKRNATGIQINYENQKYFKTYFIILAHLILIVAAQYSVVYRGKFFETENKAILVLIFIEIRCYVCVEQCCKCLKDS